MIVSQVPVADCSLHFSGPTLAVAILDKIIHNAYRYLLLVNLNENYQETGLCRTLDL